MITIEKNELLTALQIVSKAVNIKSTMPILSTILLRTTGTTLELEATDLELSISTSIACISDKCAICIDAKQLMDIIKKMPGGDINIDFDNTFKVTLSTGKKIKFNIQGNAPSTFPCMKYEEGDEIIMKTADLKDAVTGVVFCAATNDANRIMKGINIKVEDNSVRFIALDGHRVAIRNKTIADTGKTYDIIVPAAELYEVVKILPDGDVKVTINQKKIMLMVDDTNVSIRLIDGEYFKVDQMISQKFTTFITLTKKDIYDAVDRTSLLLNESERKPVVMEFTNKGIHLYAKAAKGNAEEDIEIISKEGNDIKIGFNPKYVLDMFRAIPDEKITLGMMVPKAPAVVKTNSYTYLLLPVNFAEVA